MGKNRVIDSLSSFLANTIVHRILVTQTLRPESVNHLGFEEIEYRVQAVKKSSLYNWNSSDIILLKKDIEKKVENKFKNKYSDVKVYKEKILAFIDEEVELLVRK